MDGTGGVSFTEARVRGSFVDPAARVPFPLLSGRIGRCFLPNWETSLGRSVETYLDYRSIVLSFAVRMSVAQKVSVNHLYADYLSVHIPYNFRIPT